jgi:predicted DNA-binding protein with PD1-like motif
MKWNRLSAGVLGLAFVVSAAGQTGQSNAAGEVWVQPARPIASGKAPGVKVELLGANGEEKTYAVIFSSGDEVISGLSDFARQYKVTAARFTAVGALSGAELGWFSPERKMYRANTVASQVEVASMMGDIALYKGNPFVHAHMVVSLPDGTTRAGHVLSAHVYPTLEVMVTVEPNAMHRRFAEEFGFTLIDPGAHD